MSLSVKSLNLKLDSNISNIRVSGKMRKKRLRLSTVTLKDIDIDAITLFIDNLDRERKKSKEQNRTLSIIDEIKIDRLFASLKEITYSPITLEKVNLLVKNIDIEPKNSYRVDAKSAELLAKTSFADTKQIGYIEGSKLYTAGDIIIREHLFDLYSLPLNREALKVLPTKLEIDHKGLLVNIENSVKDLLVLDNNFNINLKEAKHKLKYIYSSEKIYIYSKAKASMNYSNDSNISNLVTIDIKNSGYTTYQGGVDIRDIREIPRDITDNFLDNLRAKYYGDSKKLSVNFNSEQIKGSLFSKGYRRAKIGVRSRREFLISDILEGLPKEFQHSYASFNSNTYIDFKNSRDRRVDIDLKSDILNIRASTYITKPFNIEFSSTIPKKSKISNIDKKIKLKNISKINGHLTLGKQEINLFLDSNDLHISLDYYIKSKTLKNGLLRVGDNRIKFRGGLNNRVNISTDIKSIERFSRDIMRYYDINLPKIRGKAHVKASINKHGRIDIEFKSKKLDIEKRKIYRVSSKLSIFNNKVEISRYSLKYYNDYITHIFSNNKSYLSFKNGSIYIKRFWLNDTIILSGKYNTDKMIGDIDIVSNYFSFKNVDFDLATKIDLNIKLDRDRFFVTGTLIPLGKSIHYDTIGDGISEDSDIIIVQDEVKKESSILKNIKMNIRVKSQKPFKYISDSAKIEFMNDVTIIKDYAKDFRLFGTATVNSGYYQQENKRFFLDESHIYFSGDPKKPLLEIKATYNKEQYNIQIFISGTTDDPIINFNSNPYLTQKEILSLILFDSTGENSGNATEVYALLGGTFAKELMKSLGLSVDHLVLGQGIDDRLSVEVGEKISDDITVIYQHNNGRDGVKVRVDHSKNFETDIIMYPPNSSSIEFLYKSD
jgi:hypothetical protein